MTDEERSDAILMLWGNTSPWLLRWGTMSFFVMLLGLISLTFIIEYPDTIPAQIEITTPIPPATIHAMANGKIVSLFVKDKQIVKAGTALAIIENSANFEDIKTVKNQLVGADTSEPESTRNLGDIQPDYNAYYATYIEYEKYKDLQYHKKKIIEYQLKLSNYNKLLAQINRQVDIARQEYTIVSRQHARDSLLYFAGAAISGEDYNQSVLKFLNTKNNFSNLQQSYTRSKIQTNELEEAISDMVFDSLQTSNALELKKKSSIEKLRSSIGQWEQKYVLSSPINGTVSFFQLWSENQFVQEGEGVFTIVPKTSGKIIGKIAMPVLKSGEVEVGQRVNIKLEGFPYQEYGFLIGKISSISLVPINKTYAVNVEFPNGFKTTYKKNIGFMQKMNGSAEIVVKDTKLIERILYVFKDILINKTS